MSDDRLKDSGFDPVMEPQTGLEGEPGRVVSSRLRRDMWQVPLVLVSIAAICLAMWYRSGTTKSEPALDLIQRANSLIQAKELQAASAILVEIEPRVQDLDLDLQARFYITIGDWQVASAENLLKATPTQGRAIIDAYAQAISRSWKPDAQRRLYLAEAMIASGEHAAASVELAPLALSSTPAIAQRAQFLRRMLLQERIEEERARGTDFARLLVWIDEYISLHPDPAEEAWVAQVHASILLENNHHSGLVERLVLDMRRLEAIDDGTIDWPTLHVLLGKIYLATDRLGPAADRFNFALNELKATGAPRGDALRYMGEMHLDVGEVSRAEVRFRDALQTAGISEDSYAASELGLARSLARRAKHAEASVVFASTMRLPKFRDPVYASQISRSLRDEGLAAILSAGDKTDMIARELLEAAIRYGNLASEAAVDVEAQRDALRLKGVANETYARKILAPIIGGLDPRDAPLESVPLVMRVEANQHFVAAGESYIELDGIADPNSEEADGRLVWDAATALDMGGRSNQAVALYMRYVDECPRDDDRRPEALYRLALAHHAALEITEASDWYRMLINEVDEHDPDTTQSSFTTRAKVGLARCLAGGGETSEANLLEAEGHLRDIVDGRGAVGPDAPEYREAMFQLGRVLFALERWPDTIEVLDAALKRYSGDRRAPEYAARCGLAWLALSEEAKAQLDASPMSSQRRLEIDDARQEALRSAIEGFTAAISGLDSARDGQLDPLQMQLLRASYLRRADSIAELGNFHKAMEFYHDVERRFGEDVTAIEALVRMSNLALEYGDFTAASTATTRATIKLRRLDRQVLEGPALLDGVASDALEKWIALQPPGARNGDVE